MVVGFGRIDKYGCLDLLFVHKEYLRQGIATALCDELEKDFIEVKAYVSVTQSRSLKIAGIRLRESKRSSAGALN